VQSSTESRDRRPDRDQSERGEPAAILCQGLSKYYRGHWSLKTSVGLDRLDLEIRPGEVIGLLGPNGAGKTTTLKLLTGLIKPSAGRAWIFGVPIEDTRSRRRLGFLPEQPYFYDYLSGLEYLELAGGLSGLSGAEAGERARHWLGRVGLGERPSLRLRKYSKGMLQRLGLAAALMHEPDLLILDEPMSGLDPFGRRDVRELILEQRERGVTVLFSSHIIPDVESLCDRVAIVLRGRLHRVGTLAELGRNSVERVTVRCVPPAMFEWPSRWGEWIERRDLGDETELALRDPARLDEVLETLVKLRATIRSVTPERASLESLFLAAAGAAPAGADRRSA
jgi:ABC-2 type transport system ATP-binding protein